MILLFGKDQVLYEHPRMSCSLLTITIPQAGLPLTFHRHPNFTTPPVEEGVQAPP